MGSRFPYVILFFLFSTKLFCQDILFFKDSTQQEVKLIEITTETIKYKKFDYQDGPTFTIFKNDITKIKYQNGTEEIIPSAEKKEESIFTIQTNKTDTLKPSKTERKVGDYIKFNLQAGLVIYESFSNIPRREEQGVSHFEEYNKSSGKSYISLNFGFNFLFGKSPFVKHIIGVNYLRSHGKYLRKTSSVGYHTYGEYDSKIDFINAITGLRITLFKKLHIEPLIALNIVAKTKTTFTGAKTSIVNYSYQTNTIYYVNEPARNSTETTFSFCPKICYEVNNKRLKTEIYFGYNYGVQYRLPWYQFGINIFPFKKLR